MKYQLLALDLDDTLLSEDLTISQKNIDAIKKMEADGVKIILVSGRPFDSMIKYIDVLDIHSEEDYIVSFNGAVINKISGEEIFSGIIEGDVLHKLVDMGREHKISVQLYNNDLTVEKYTDRTEHYEFLTGMKSLVVDDLKEIPRSIKVLFNHIAGPELEALRLALVDEFDDLFNIFYSKPNYIEVLNKKSNKGLAVAYMAKQLGIDQASVVAVGDGFNDVAMIEYAGVGVAVANAPDGVKAVADYVTKVDHNHSVVDEVYEKFFK